MKKQRNIFKAGVFAFLLLSIVIWGCKKEEDLPDNPYDNVDYTTDSTPTYPTGPTTIAGIHERILMVKCNNPGCHDGTFEPDFRTVQSAWSTLVYHELVKNTADSGYTYRVVPYDTSSSILWYRLNNDSPALQQMPATGNLLTADELNNIATWIRNGAPDMYGNIAVLPNKEPEIIAFLATNDQNVPIDTLENRVDSTSYLPFYVTNNETVRIYMVVDDDSTDIQNLQVNQLKLSYEKDNFSSATTVQAFFIPFVNVWMAEFSTSSFLSDTTVYMRYYVNDGDHAQNTEFPRNESDDFYKTYAAFYVKP